jgi:hypothetical protein
VHGIDWKAADTFSDRGIATLHYRGRLVTAFGQALILQIDTQVQTGQLPDAKQQWS